MQYTASAPFHGDLDKAFTLAASVLTGLGFRIVSRTADAIEAAGPTGPGMASSRHSPILGASQIRIAAGENDLQLEADLGGAERLARFVSLFPQVLCLSLALFFCILFGVLFGPGKWIIPSLVAPGGVAVVWAILGPILARLFRERTSRGLDVLLANMSTIGEAP